MISLDDPALRTAALGKLAHALKLAAGLRDDMDAWWQSEPVTLRFATREENARALDLVMETSPTPPVDDWYNRVGDVLYNYRVALNRLLKNVLHATGSSGDGNFPIHKAEQGWRQWLKKNRIRRPVTPHDRALSVLGSASGG